MNDHLSHMRNNPYLPSQQSVPHAFNLSRVRVHNMTDEGPPGPGLLNGRSDGPDTATEDAPRVILFRNLFLQSEANLNRLLQPSEPLSEARTPQWDHVAPENATKSVPPSKKPTRAIDEDDYGDEEDEDDDSPIAESPLLQKVAAASAARGNASPASTIPGKPPLVQRTSTASDPSKTSDDARKQLQHDKLAAEEAAKLSFHTMFYTLEHDRVAMLEQQKIDELDRQVEAEVSGDQRNKTSNATTGGTQQGSLSSANLGASSLMLKHLLARIDSKRSMVRAQDWQLRKLIGEVRKNRSKWASEDKIGQEELYEAAEKVLQELKALTEHSGPFLNRVNKRDAPDYYNIIKHPMDIGTMMKKLKNIAYKSKKEFVDDLNLIWNNCLRYNTDPNHFLRKKALIMQKHTESLVFLIPDIVVRDRAEVEAEERRMQHLDAELDGMEDSDDEPIMASRGRKAPSKVAKKGNSSTRKAPPMINEGTPGADSKPFSSMSSSTNLRNNFLRADSDAPMEGIVNGFSTPPPGGNLTPYGLNGVFNIGAPASQADASDVEGNGTSVNEIAQPEESELVDLEFRTWKQVTKKARAVAAAERNRLFVNNRLNPEEPALLRSKAGMRRFARLQKKLLQPQGGVRTSAATPSQMRKDSIPEVPGETLAEGVEAADDDNILPDYYDPVSAIPDIDERLRWDEDEDGHVFNHAEECLRVVPKGHFTAPDSTLAKKINANMRQMQETRRVCAKIGIVRQMQMQMQVSSLHFFIVSMSGVC
jgi:transcriptional activator SPT7